MKDFVIPLANERRKSLIFEKSINGAQGALEGAERRKVESSVYQVVGHLRSSACFGGSSLSYSSVT
jgi:hypothetical protein